MAPFESQNEAKALQPARNELAYLSMTSAEMASFYSPQRSTMNVAEREAAMFGSGGTLDLNSFDAHGSSIYTNSDQTVRVGNKKYPASDVTARDWGATLKKSAERTVQAAQNRDLIYWETPAEGGIKRYPRRGHEDEAIDYDACSKANKAFPQLSKYLGEGPGKIDPDLIAATIRNEQFYFDNYKDAGPEHYVQLQHKWPFNQDESVGPAQMQVQNMEHLARQFPNQLGRVADAVRNGIDTQHAPYFVGAYFADVINGIESKHKPNYIASNTWKQISEHWQKGERNEALIIAYNPDPNQINHIFTQLDSIKAPDWD